jgi:hypothetical protein
MPFAHEYKVGMDLPKEGDAVKGFTVESVLVSHVGVCPGRYEYPTEIVVRGSGSREKVRAAFKQALNIRRTLFSGYGNPYQCSTGKVTVERVDAEHFRVCFRGIGVRVHLKEELIRFLAYLTDEGRLGAAMTGADAAAVHQGTIDTYLKCYQRVHPRPPGQPRDLSSSLGE